MSTLCSGELKIKKLLQKTFRLTNLFSHRIETGNSKPIKKAPYRQNPEMRRETERQVKEMLENGFITESDSPWNIPVVLVKKNKRTMMVLYRSPEY